MEEKSSIEKALEKVEEGRSKSVIVNNSSISTLSLLGLCLIVLKALGYITWSWVWVLAPFWIPVAIGILLVVLIVVFILIYTTLKSKDDILPIVQEDENPKKEEVKETPVGTKKTIKSKTKKSNKSNTKTNGEHNTTREKQLGFEEPTTSNN